MTPERATAASDWDAVRNLIGAAFAYMEPRLGHPSRAVKDSPVDLERAAADGTCWLIIETGVPVACLFTRSSRDDPTALYIGKLAVADAARGRGFARELVEAAAKEARMLGFRSLTLDTGAVFPELHDTFARLGFGPPRPRKGEPGIVSLSRAL